MHILLTGATSFTGMWFVKELLLAGHTLTLPLKRELQEYSGLRLQRLQSFMHECTIVDDCPFGSDAFLELIASLSHVDVFCHHAADVTDYKSSDFNAVAALNNNTYRARDVLKALKEKGCRRVVLSGSVFEPHEGVGDSELRAVSPYGLSKGLTSEYFWYYTDVEEMSFNKFVIPNPFGPFEEERYTTSLIKTWMDGQVATVNTPDYIRDNIPVTLLAKAYQLFVKRALDKPGCVKFRPCGYVGTQGDFTIRFAKEMRQRLSLPCDYILKKQTEFPEPIRRINSDHLDWQMLGWNESKAWDELAAYYEQTHSMSGVTK
jgi:nucleoside-diphosphate-sugar epimerase